MKLWIDRNGKYEATGDEVLAISGMTLLCKGRISKVLVSDEEVTVIARLEQEGEE